MVFASFFLGGGIMHSICFVQTIIYSVILINILIINELTNSSPMNLICVLLNFANLVFFFKMIY